MTIPHPPFVIYQWLAESGYLLHALLPGYAQIEAHVDDSVDAVLDRLPHGPGTFAFHLNCTRTGRFPQQRAKLIEALEARCVRVLNGSVTDISKRHVHRACTAVGLPTLEAPRHGDPAELLIVKTDLNFGGDSEWALSSQEREALGIGTGSDIIWTPSHYRVLPRADIDAAWWADDRLVIERFAANRRHCWYRAYLFLGWMALCELENPNEIKKVGDSRVVRTILVRPNDAVPGDRAELAGLVDQLSTVARALTLDVGTVDVVMDDAGRHYVIDVNSTPAYNYPIPGVVDHLRRALPV